MKVLCIGSAVIDIIARPINQSIQWKEKQRISDIQIQTGGDAANQSVHLAALGCQPALAACIGDDMNGKMLQAVLEKRGVMTHLMRVKKDCATGTAMVLVDEKGERHTFSVKGAHSTLSRSDLPWDFPGSCRAISLASIFSMPLLEKDGLVEYLREAKARGILVFADLAADKLGQGLKGVSSFLPYVDYFLPSLYDVLEMTGKSTPEEAAAVFLEQGVGQMVIKCGEKGCCCVGTGYSGWIPAVKVKTVDTTGAGDCMSAVFLSRILAGDSVEEACRYACKVASYSTLFLGASSVELTEEKIREMFGTVQ